MRLTLLIILCILPVLLAGSLYVLDKEYFVCPIAYCYDFEIRNDSHGEGSFAARRSGNRTHQGIDLTADLGDPVMACRSGIVRVAEASKGMGNQIILRHLGGMTTIYGHLSRIDVRPGQYVRQGQVIGAVGKTGNANYSDILPHLHFEIKVNNISQDPAKYL